MDLGIGIWKDTQFGLVFCREGGSLVFVTPFKCLGVEDYSG